MSARRLAVGCGVVLVVLVLLAGCGIARLYAELPAGEHPVVDFESAEIRAAGETGLAELERELDGMERRYGTPHVGRRAVRDHCEAGQDNFTRQDRYAYVCRIEEAQLVPVSEPFREQASRLGESLLEGDCPNGTDTDRALREPFDHPRELDQSSGECIPGRGISPRLRTWFSAAPDPDELERAERALALCYPSSFPPERCTVDRLDLRTAAAAAPDDAAWLALVVVEDVYHTVPWECPWPASWFRDSCRS